MPLFLIPLLTMVIAQGLKAPAIWKKERKLYFNSLSAYGGFPSSHAALAASIATLAVLVSGFYSLAFAIAFAFALIILRDAIGARREISRQAVWINKLAKKKVVSERIGHDPYEVIGGVIIGIVLTWVFYVFFV